MLCLVLSSAACQQVVESDASEDACGAAPEETGPDAASDDATDATDAAPPPASHQVSSLAMTAGKSGAVVAYQVDCLGCVAGPTRTLTGELRGMTLKLTADDEGTLWKVGEAFPITDPKSRGAVVAGSARGDDFHFAVERAGGGAQLLGGALPGGSVVSAAVSSVSFKQTQGATFGEKVNAGLALTIGSDDAWLAAYDAASKDAAKLMAVHVKGGVTVESIEAAKATTGVLAFAPVLGSPAFAVGSAPLGTDGEVRVGLAAGTSYTAPMAGAPAALWTDGKSFRVAIEQTNGTLHVWDGRSTLRGPRVDEAACRAVAFDETGAAVVLHVGQRSATLYVQKELDLLTPVFIEPSTVTIDPVRVTSEKGINEAGIKRCAVTVSGDEIYVAWAEPDALAGPDAGLPSIVQVVTWRRSTETAIRRTRHDTAKNSISNIR